MTATAAEREVVKIGLDQIPTDGLRRGLAYMEANPFCTSGDIVEGGLP